MRAPYIFLTTVVPGPHDPTQGIDVYLQPLIEELKKLWNDGVETYDVSTKKKFGYSLLCYGRLMIFLHTGCFLVGVRPVV